MISATLKLWIKHRIATSAAAGLAGRARELRRRAMGALRPELGLLEAEPLFIDAALDRLIKPADHCLDVGAHIGAVSYDLSRRAPQGRLTMVEPLATKARWLRARFPQAVVHEAAVSDRNGEAPFFEDPARPGFSSLVERPGRIAHKVRLARLDDLVEGPVDFIKIDVEGHEHPALAGAERLLAALPPILFESGAILPNHAANQARLFTHLSDLGYRIYAPVDLVHGRAPLDHATYDRYRTYPFTAFNYFALSETDADAFMT